MSNHGSSLKESQSGLIKVEYDQIVIEKCIIDDQDVVSFFKDCKPEDYQYKLNYAIKLGVISLRSVLTTEKIDYIQKEFNALDERFKTKFDDIVDQLDTRFEEIFGEKGKVSTCIDEHFGEDGKLVKEVFDPMRKGSPLYELRTEILDKIELIRQDIGVKGKEDEVKEKTPLKGYDFEDLCDVALAKYVRINGDTLEKTSEKAGNLTGSKVGDFIITLGNNKKIAFEVKDTGSYSVPKINNLLDEALKNRGASYAILIMKNVEALPNSIGWFNEISSDRLVCALTSEKFSDETIHDELLLIAYKWAKSKLLLETAKEQQINAVVISDSIKIIKENIKELGKIKTGCQNIRNANDGIDKIVQNLEREITSQLSNIISAIE